MVAVTTPPTLVIERIPLTEVELLPGNPRRGDVNAVARSLERFGQRTPIVVNQPGNVVLKGNHTVRAARELGWEALDVVFVQLDEVTANAYALADNRTSELGGFDHDDLIAMLAQVAEAERALAVAAGYSEDDLVRLLEGSSNGEPEPHGELLSVADVSFADPKHGVARGDLWHLGEHVMVCCSPLSDWAQFMPLLEPGDLLACYPTPHLPLADLPDHVHKLVLVQPDAWMAGHLLDKYAAVYGPDSVRRG